MYSFYISFHVLYLIYLILLNRETGFYILFYPKSNHKPNLRKNMTNPNMYTKFLEAKSEVETVKLLK